VKDLESPEHRAMEREMLRKAREAARPRDRHHIDIAIALFFVAILLYAAGYAGASMLVVAGAVTELAAWRFLFLGSRREPGNK
jgi:small-conductance mechanosensitive channel